jgi:predicted nucleotidyltransferase
VPASAIDAALLDRVLERAMAPAVRAIVLLGSAGRGQATPWSDLDVERWVENEADRREDDVSLLGDRLLIIHTRIIKEVLAELESPERAIWAAPAYRNMRVLHDPYGDAASVGDTARRFEWHSIRDRAIDATRLNLAKSAEFVFKLRAATEHRDEGSALHATVALAGRCARNVAMARGVLVSTENEYYAKLWEVAGEAWRREHRAALGLDCGGVFAQARAACRLYVETLRVLDDVLDDQTREIAARAVAAMPR